MGLAYIFPVGNPADCLFNVIELSPGSPPPRPHPEPPLGIWGPTDPRPSLPIAGWNPDGSWGPPGGGGGGGGGVPEVPEGTKLVAVKLAETQPEVPAGLPPDTKLLDVVFGPGQKGQAWSMPYAAPVK